MAASEGDDGVGTPNRPEHAGLFEPGADHGFTAGLDYTRADKEVLASKLGIAHARHVPVKVVSLDANLFDHFGIGGNDGTKGTHQLLDFSFVE